MKARTLYYFKLEEIIAELKGEFGEDVANLFETYLYDEFYLNENNDLFYQLVFPESPDKIEGMFDAEDNNSIWNCLQYVKASSGKEHSIFIHAFNEVLN